jgi:hypothetical protein
MNALLQPIRQRPIERPRYQNANLADQARWIADNERLLRAYYNLLREWLDVESADDEYAVFCRVQHDFALLSDERRQEMGEERYAEGRSAAARLSDAIAGRVPL